MTIFEIESEVKGYSRSFPVTFTHAIDTYLIDEKGQRYLDFFSGAGALNYGHNHPRFKKAVTNYIDANGLVHGLDMHSTVRKKFLSHFKSNILEPRNLDYKIQFCGPTGTNAVEAAIRLARKVTGRDLIASFSNGYHGMTQGALALTANSYYRDNDSVLQHNTVFLPFDGYMGPNVNTIEYIEKMLEDPSSGLDTPAAFILETIQGEGGVNEASEEWLTQLSALAKKHGILLIVDDIQVGSGRTGDFFSFERMGFEPDMVLLSKSISGFGLPLAMVLIKPEYDQWKPGEHTGTFRSNGLALLTALEATSFWSEESFLLSIEARKRQLKVGVEKLGALFNDEIKEIRGRGFIYGIEFYNKDTASQIQKYAFKNNMIIETSGAHNHVLKLLPALTMESSAMQNGLDIIKNGILESTKVTQGSPK